MSVHVISWVMQNSEATLGDRLVLIALADKAEHDGTNAWPSVARLAREARLSERQVQRCLRNLEADGSIRREEGLHRSGAQRHGTNVYSVVMAKGDISAPLAKGDIHDAQRVTPMSPELSLEPSSVCVEGPVLSLTAKEPRPAHTCARPLKVDRKPVTENEQHLAYDLLQAWNAATGQALTSSDWIAKIVMRIREQPHLSVQQHNVIVAAALRNPWWKGPPSPSVVYGSGAQFERAMLAAEALVNGHTIEKPEAKRYGRGMTPGQILEMTRGSR